MTELLYQTDSYLQEFDATITSVLDESRAVILDKTAFYTCGGGELSDLHRFILPREPSSQLEGSDVAIGLKLKSGEGPQLMSGAFSSGGVVLAYSSPSTILPRTRGNRTGAWAWQYSALLYWLSFVSHSDLAQTRPVVNRFDGRVMPLIAAPLTVSVMLALLVMGRHLLLNLGLVTLFHPAEASVARVALLNVRAGTLIGAKSPPRVRV
jgi:hypothetical protein